MKRTTADLFCDLLFNLPELKELPEGVSVLNPYREPSTRKLVQAFMRKYYASQSSRILVLGINPGRMGGGLTGVPFTDPVAMEDVCGFPNNFDRKRELSSRFIYNVVEQFDSVTSFYNNCLLSAICPMGFTRNGKNFNYYDHPVLLRNLHEFLLHSLKIHANLGVRTDKLVVLGKKNSIYIDEINRELKLFEKVVTLEHPRFIMQYRSSKVDSYVGRYLAALS